MHDVLDFAKAAQGAARKPSGGRKRELAMIVQSLDHVNIRVKDPAATIAFFNDVLGMPSSPVRKYWLTDAAGRPVVHVGSAAQPYSSDGWRPFKASEDSGVIHHVALSCSSFDAVLARLRERGLDHQTNEMPQMNLRQIFVAEPGGVLLELNFRGD
jgi:catechol 2,3-dioxygenase-like lactoylglutathione lyase family enzyme